MLTGKRSVTINGETSSLESPPEMSLCDFLLEKSSSPQKEKICREGNCGACAVMLNGELVNSCIILCGQLSDGDAIGTSEGCKEISSLAPLHDCFLQEERNACKRCQSGMILAAKILLQKKPSPTRNEIAETISGILCPCLRYEKIITAIEKASNLLGEHP